MVHRHTILQRALVLAMIICVQPMPIHRMKVYLQKQYQGNLGEKDEKIIKLVACTASLATPPKTDLYCKQL